MNSRQIRLTQYERPFDNATVSDVPATTRIRNLAAQISDIMNNPHLPEHLKYIIAAEINEADEVDDFSPETVLQNLKRCQDDTGDKKTVLNLSPSFDNAPTISDIPYSKPPQKKRTPTQKPDVKKKKVKPGTKFDGVANR